jgi:hypothetical protein
LPTEIVPVLDIFPERRILQKLIEERDKPPLLHEIEVEA